MKISIALAVLISVIACHDIFDYGTVTVGTHVTYEQELENARALMRAVHAANASSDDRTVIIGLGSLI